MPILAQLAEDSRVDGEGADAMDGIQEPAGGGGMNGYGGGGGGGGYPNGMNGHGGYANGY